MASPEVPVIWVGTITTPATVHMLMLTRPALWAILFSPKRKTTSALMTKLHKLIYMLTQIKRACNKIELIHNSSQAQSVAKERIMSLSERLQPNVELLHQLVY